MNLPNFAAVAKKYAPSIAFKYTEGQINLIEMGRFISFDLSTADGIEYLNRIGSVGTEVVQALHQAKAQYDLDIQQNRAVVNPSRVELLKHLGPRDNEDVIRAQLLEVDNYALLCYMVDGGEWPPYLWEVTCPELAELARNIRSLHDDQQDVPPVEVLNEIFGESAVELMKTKIDLHAVLRYVEQELTRQEEDMLITQLLAVMSITTVAEAFAYRWHNPNELNDELQSLASKYMDTIRLSSDERYAVLMFIRTGIEYDGFSSEFRAGLAKAREAYISSNPQPTQPKEHKSMNTTINYHSRLGTANGQLTGTVTLSINGELAIVDITCPKDDIKVTYNWVTMPERGYDTTVHSLVRWFDDVAAAAVMITVYPDGGRPQTVTVTLEA